MTEPLAPLQFVILADESANWRVAGLCQLERLVLAINEWAETVDARPNVELVILWRPAIPSPDRRLPDCRGVSHVRWTESTNALRVGARVLSPRLLLERNRLGEFLDGTKAVEAAEGDSALSWQQLFDRFEQTCRAGKESEGWRFLAGPGDIDAGEREFLRRSGKSQDGVVSRFINRPISRTVSRVLLKFPITPNAWTMLILILPLVAFLFLMRGDYAGFVVGTALFQIYNILDGCDGEIARAKYLDCEKGRRLDASCDLIANLVFVLCLGVGLFRQPSVSASMGAVYLLESLITVFLMAVRLSRYFMELLARDTGRVVSHRHEEIVMEAGERVFGRALTAFLFQIAKRDVAFFAFLLLAIASAPSWILHFFFIVSVSTLLLALKDIRSSSPPRA